MNARKQALAYEKDLAYMHNTAWGAFADVSAPGLLALFEKSGIHDGLVVDLGGGSGI